MKYIVRYILSVILPCYFFISCSKETEVVFDPQPNQHQPGAYEVVFDSLAWIYDTDGIGEWMYFMSPSRPDLFETSGQRVDAWLNLDSSSNWIQIRSGFESKGDQFTYSVSPPFLVVYKWPPDLSMVGKKSSIKIKY